MTSMIGDAPKRVRRFRARASCAVIGVPTTIGTKMVATFDSVADSLDLSVRPCRLAAGEELFE